MADVSNEYLLYCCTIFLSVLAASITLGIALVKSAGKLSEQSRDTHINVAPPAHHPQVGQQYYQQPQQVSPQQSQEAYSQSDMLAEIHSKTRMNTSTLAPSTLRSKEVGSQDSSVNDAVSALSASK